MLIDGNPTWRISDIRKVALVMKDRVRFDPARLIAEAGVTSIETTVK